MAAKEARKKFLISLSAPSAVKKCEYTLIRIKEYLLKKELITAPEIQVIQKNSEQYARLVMVAVKNTAVIKEVIQTVLPLLDEVNKYNLGIMRVEEELVL